MSTRPKSEIAHLATEPEPKGKGFVFLLGIGLFLLCLFAAGTVLEKEDLDVVWNAVDRWDGGWPGGIESNGEVIKGVVVWGIGLVLLGLAGLVYFLPTIVANDRRCRSTGIVLFLNFLIGWTILGWILLWVIVAIAPRDPEPGFN